MFHGQKIDHMRHYVYGSAMLAASTAGLGTVSTRGEHVNFSFPLVGFAVVILVLALAPPSFACDQAPAGPGAADGAAPDAPSVATAETITVQLGSEAHCATTCQNVRASLLEQEGVISAEFDSTALTATIIIDTAKLTTDALLARMQELGLAGTLTQA